MHKKKGCKDRNEILSEVKYSSRSSCAKQCSDRIDCASFEWFGGDNKHKTLGGGVCSVSSSCRGSFVSDLSGDDKDVWLYVKNDYGTGISYTYNSYIC